MKMIMKRAAVIITLALLLNLQGITIGFASIETMTLLTEEEGAMADTPSGSYEIRGTLNNGPKVEVLCPKIDESNKPPLKVIINFVPQNGHEVNSSSLKVECLKLITIDLTDRVLPYTTRAGIKIENARLPSGNHTLRLTISDAAGGITQEIFKVKVFK